MQLNVDRARWTWAILAYVLTFLRRHFNFSVCVINTKDLEPDPGPSEDHLNRFQFRKLSDDDMQAACVDPDIPLDSHFVDYAKANGDMGYGVFDGARLIGLTFRSTKGGPLEQGLWIKVTAPKIRYGYRTFVHPAYRGQDLQSSISLMGDKEYFDMGYEKDISYVDPASLSSLKSTYKNATRTVVGFAGYWKVGSRFFTWRSPGARRHFQFHHDEAG